MAQPFTASPMDPPPHTAALYLPWSATRAEVSLSSLSLSRLVPLSFFLLNSCDALFLE